LNTALKIKHSNTEVITFKTKQKNSTPALQFSHSCYFSYSSIKI